MWVKAQRVLATDTVGAIRLLQWNAEMYPRSHSTHAELARVYLAAGDTARARDEALRALAILPTHAAAQEVVRRVRK